MLLGNGSQDNDWNQDFRNRNHLTLGMSFSGWCTKSGRFLIPFISAGKVLFPLFVSPLLPSLFPSTTTWQAIKDATFDLGCKLESTIESGTQCYCGAAWRLYQTGNIEINLQGRRAHKEHINHTTQNESPPQPWRPSSLLLTYLTVLNIFSYPYRLLNIQYLITTLFIYFFKEFFWRHELSLWLLGGKDLWFLVPWEH